MVLDARQSILQAGGSFSESDEQQFSDSSFDDVEGIEEDVTSLYSLDSQVISIRVLMSNSCRVVVTLLSYGKTQLDGLKIEQNILSKRDTAALNLSCNVTTLQFDFIFKDSILPSFVHAWRLAIAVTVYTFS